MKRMFFDGRNLIHGLNGTFARSGIYFVSINLLKEFLKSGQFDVTVFCNIKDILFLKPFLEKECGRQLNFFFRNEWGDLT